MNRLIKSSTRAMMEPVEPRQMLTTSLSLLGTQSIIASTNVRVSIDTTQQSEMSVAINPTNPLNIVAFTHRIGASATMGSYYTFDGGNTWTAKVIDNSVDGINGTFRFDPTLAFDGNGRLYLAYGVDPSGGTRQLVVIRSLDGGASYAGTSIVRTGSSLDKWTINTGRDPVNATQQNVYLAYRITAGATSVRLAASVDGGVTWPVDTLVPDDAQAGSDFSSFGMPAVGPNGELYVVWEDYDLQPANGQIKMAFSSNGGATFAADSLISLTPITRGNGNGFASSARYHISAQPDRGILSVPTIAVDRSTGPRRGRIYAAYTTRGAGGTTDNTDVVVRFSDNNGATWSAPVAVHTAANNSSQFLPWLDVDPKSGAVAVGYYDTRADFANNQLAELWSSLSIDGGATWAQGKLASAQSNQSLSNPSRYAGNYLEYIGLAMHDGTIQAVWADSRDSLSNLEMYTARASLFSATTNTLNISGDALSANTISVQRSTANSAYVEVIVNGVREYAGLLASINSIVVTGGLMADTITIGDFGTEAKPVLVTPGSGEDVLSINPLGTGSAYVRFNQGDRLAALTIGNGATLELSGGDDKAIITKSLSIASTGTLDLNNGDMIYDYTGPSPLATVASLIRTARADGSWTGFGITSGVAPGNPTTFGAIEATDYKSIYGPDATFQDQLLDDTTVLVKYTYFGDYDFNGKVDGADYARIDSRFNLQSKQGNISGWFNGDFDYDDKIDGADYALIDAAFNSQGPPLRSASTPRGSTGRNRIA